MYITAKNIKSDGILLKDITYVSKEVHDEIYTRCNPEKGDILYIKDGATTGIATINSLSEPFSMLSSVALLKPIKHLNNYYLLDFLQSPLCYNFTRNNMKGVGITRVTLTQMERWLIPIAPLKEQKCIVEQVDDLFSAVIDINRNKEELFDYIKNAKSKILDLAVRGKLVPQDPNDEPASVLLERIKAERPEGKKKAKSTSDNSHYGNLPFEIPQSWAWAKFQDVFEIVMGQSPEGIYINQTNGCEFHQGKTFFGKKLLNNSHVFTENPTKIADPDSLLISVRAPVGDVNITNRIICIGRGLCALKPLGGFSTQFMFQWVSYFKDIFNEKATGTTFLAISGDTLRSQDIPIPPYKEQRHILDCIESLYEQLDMIIYEL
jgi:type I restriction enzyme S subunit